MPDRERLLRPDRLAALAALLDADDRQLDDDRGATAHFEVVERACRLWLDLDGQAAGVAPRLDRWCRRHPAATTAQFARVRTALRDRGPVAGRQALAAWDVPTASAVGDDRWWADRLVSAVADGILRRQEPVQDDVTPAAGGFAAPMPWAEQLTASLARGVADVRTHVVVVRGARRDLRGLVHRLGRLLEGVGVRLLHCDVDRSDLPTPLPGWLDVLWDDVQWNLVGDRGLARLAPAIDRHLAASVEPGLPQLDLGVVEVTRRLLASVRVPTVVLAHGSDRALRRFDRFLGSLAADEASPSGLRLAVTDVRLPAAHRPQDPSYGARPWPR